MKEKIPKKVFTENQDIFLPGKGNKLRVIKHQIIHDENLEPQNIYKVRDLEARTEYWVMEGRLVSAETKHDDVYKPSFTIFVYNELLEVQETIDCESEVELLDVVKKITSDDKRLNGKTKSILINICKKSEVG